MTTNKTTKTTTSKSGKTIKITIERGTWEETVNLDGHECGTKTNLIDQTEISIIDETGKVLMSGSKLGKLTDKKMIAQGGVASLGRAVLGQAMYDAISILLAEVDAVTPKTAEQIKIETAKAEGEAKYWAWYNSPEQIAARKFEREMEREDSDY